jgi:hypothetical protein
MNQPALSGRVESVERPPEPGTLGPVLEALRLVLMPETVVPLLTALVAWQRIRATQGNKEFEVTVRRTDDSTTVTLSAKRLDRLDATALTAEITQLAKQLESGAGGDEATR